MNNKMLLKLIAASLTLVIAVVMYSAIFSHILDLIVRKVDV